MLSWTLKALGGKLSQPSGEASVLLEHVVPSSFCEVLGHALMQQVRLGSFRIRLTRLRQSILSACLGERPRRPASRGLVQAGLAGCKQATPSVTAFLCKFQHDSGSCETAVRGKRGNSVLFAENQKADYGHFKELESWDKHTGDGLPQSTHCRPYSLTDHEICFQQFSFWFPRTTCVILGGHKTKLVSGLQALRTNKSSVVCGQLLLTTPRMGARACQQENPDYKIAALSP
jgi:hypothetical protein